MQLVYLYIEKYKNIKNQEFNFSSQYKCEYKNEILSIVENPEYIKKFFGNNIEISAIVGENGSGKSSLINSIISKSDERVVFAVKDENEDILKITREKFLDENDCILYADDVDAENYYNEYNVNQLVAMNYGIDDRYKFNNIAISFFSNNHKIEFLKDLKFLPSHIELRFFKTIEDIYFESILGYRIEYVDDILDAMQNFHISNSEINKLKVFLQNEMNIAINESTTSIKYYLYIREFLYKVSKRDRYAMSIVEDILMEYNQNIPFRNKLDKLYSQTREEIFKNIIEDIDSINNSNDNTIIELEINSNVEKLLVNIHRGFFDIHFYSVNNNLKVYFSDLSNGEQKLLLILGKIFYVVRKEYKDSDKPLYLLLDEPEIHLHPKWQKNFINILISFLQNTEILKNKIVHLIVTSHSPFILSDISNQNIVFLRAGEQVDGLEQKQTFGANIHTLLSDSFFMSEGLMGEFAKERIEEVIKFLKGDSSDVKDKEEAWNLINIIGEPFLKQKLQEMYFKRFNDDKLNETIEQLEKELQRLKNVKS